VYSYKQRVGGTWSRGSSKCGMAACAAGHLDQQGSDAGAWCVDA